MKARIVLFLSLVISISSNAQFYKYSIDLNKCEEDQLQVELFLSDVNKDEIIFHFPKIVPGTYAVEDYGKYISDLKAFDKQGNKLKVKKKGKNSYHIKNAQTINRITYSVEDTWDSGVRKNKIFEPAGTSFEKGKYFYLNNGGLFGYIEGSENNQFEIQFNKTPDLYASTSLPGIQNESYSSFTSENYAQLVDSPILFAKADTFSIKIKNCTVHVGAYHSGGKEIAQELKPVFKTTMKAISGFYDELPADDYHFLLYIKDAQKEFTEFMAKPSLLSLIGLSTKYSTVGALEHGRSSSYYLIDMGEVDSRSFLSDLHYSENLKDIAIHEFMHILTPLNLRSERIDQFDFQNPQMSKHLWLYEGVTEYFAGLISLKSGLITPHNYLNETIKSKWDYAQKFPWQKMSFTEMSENVLKKKYHNEYQQVYMRGAILAMCLDLEIINLTNGAKDLRAVLMDMLNDYDVNKAIPEDKLIQEIVSRVDPSLQTFFDDYISGNQELLINHYLHYAGVRFFLFEELNLPASLKSSQYGILKTETPAWKTLINGKMKVSEVTTESPFKVGDIINTFEYQEAVIDDNGKAKVKEGESILLQVTNEGQDRSVELIVKFSSEYKKNYYQIDDEVEDNILQIRNKWFNF